MGDKVSGALMKLRGSLTRRPGLKVSSIMQKPKRNILTEGRPLALAECTELTDVMRAESIKFTGDCSAYTFVMIALYY